MQFGVSSRGMQKAFPQCECEYVAVDPPCPWHGNHNGCIHGVARLPSPAIAEQFSVLELLFLFLFFYLLLVRYTMLHSYVADEVWLARRVVRAKRAGERLLSSVDTNMAAHILDVSSTVAARLTLVERPAVPYPRSHLWNRKKILKGAH